MRKLFILAVAGFGAVSAQASIGWDYTDGSDTTVYANNNGYGKALVVQSNDTGIVVYGSAQGIYAEGISGYGAGVTAVGPTGLRAVSTEEHESPRIAVDALGGAYGVRSEATESSGIGVSGVALADYGVGIYGVGYDNAIYGEVSHVVQNTSGVKGIAGTGSSGAGHGLNGQGLIGVSGYSAGTINNTYGVYGNANGTGNYYSTYGIFGTAANGSTNWSGYFTGNVYVGGTFSNPSDIKFKKNVQPLNGGLEKIMALHPKTYDMKVEEFKGKVMLPEGNRYGLIAQELEAVLPDLVQKVSAPADLPKPGSPEAKNYVQQPNTEFKSVDYISLIPILIAAIQEQQAEIEALKKGR